MFEDIEMGPVGQPVKQTRPVEQVQPAESQGKTISRDCVKHWLSRDSAIIPRTTIMAASFVCFLLATIANQGWNNSADFKLTVIAFALNMMWIIFQVVLLYMKIPIQYKLSSERKLKYFFWPLVLSIVLFLFSLAAFLFGAVVFTKTAPELRLRPQIAGLVLDIVLIIADAFALAIYGFNITKRKLELLWQAYDSENPNPYTEFLAQMAADEIVAEIHQQQFRDVWYNSPAQFEIIKQASSNSMGRSIEEWGLIFQSEGMAALRDPTLAQIQRIKEDFKSETLQSFEEYMAIFKVEDAAAGRIATPSQIERVREDIINNTVKKEKEYRAIFGAEDPATPLVQFTSTAQQQRPLRWHVGQ